MQDPASTRLAYPDCPEAVALALLEKILEREDPAQRNEPPAPRMIELYAQCLAAVRGGRKAVGCCIDGGAHVLGALAGRSGSSPTCWLRYAAGEKGRASAVANFPVAVNWGLLGDGAAFLFGGLTGTGARWFMYVIKRQRDNATEWLLSFVPEGWGARDQAMLFETRREARAAAVAIKLSGDWSIDPGFATLRAPEQLPPR